MKDQELANQFRDALSRAKSAREALVARGYTVAHKSGSTINFVDPNDFEFTRNIKETI